MQNTQDTQKICKEYANDMQNMKNTQINAPKIRKEES